MRFRSLVWAGLGLAVTISVAACGGDDDGGGSSEGSGASGAAGPGAGGSGGAPGTGGGPGAGGGGGDGGAGGGGGGQAAVCPGGPYADNPLEGGSAAQMVQGGFSFLEGPVWFAEEGALYFSNMKFGTPNPPPLNGPEAEMVRFTPPSTFDVVIQNSSTNGLAVDGDGGLIGCTHDTRSVSRIEVPSGAREVVVDRYMGSRFNSPNDLVLRGDGNLYFSDPDWQLSQPSELPMAVYRMAPGGEVSVVDTLDKPNGVALSPDGGTLYVGAIDGVIRRYALDAGGAPGPAEDFAIVQGPDGMAVDCAGNLYVTGSAGVQVFSPQGAALGTITGTGGATNAAFGGAERRTLYITAGGALYSIELAIPGYPY